MNLRCALVIVIALAAAIVGAAPQASIDDLVRQLSSANTGTRLHAVQLLADASSVDAAVPLASAIDDSDDAVQIAAIGAELNIFLAEKIVARKRIGYVVEVRKSIAADAVFALGPAALGARPVPAQVFTALRQAIRDDTPRVGLEALYAFGTLASEPSGGRRRELLAAGAPEFASMIGAADPAFRYGALLVIGRVYGQRRGDGPIDQALGDAVISALNDRDEHVRLAAMAALGAMRYGRAVQGLTDLFGYYGRRAEAETALEALALIGHSSSSRLFEEQLSSRNGAIRAIAVEGLARTGDRSTLRAIDSMGADRDERVQLARGFAAALLGDAPIDPIAAALRTPKQRDRALAYLVELAPGRTAAYARLARDPDPRVRADIADALGLAGDPTALPIVEPLVTDPEAPVVLAADRASARLRAAARLHVS